MSTLNLGGSPILTPMETGTCVWENASIKITGYWRKKDNVVDVRFSWEAKQQFNPGNTSNAMSPTGDIIPKSPLSQRVMINYIGSAWYQIFFNTTGSVEFVNRGSGTIGSNYSSQVACCYLVDD